MQLTDLPQILDDMLSKQKEKRAKTFVARYKGKNLIMRSGKSSWKQVNHAKSAITNHFHGWIHRYTYGFDHKYDEASYKQANRREKEFKDALFKLIEIVELTD